MYKLKGISLKTYRSTKAIQRSKRRATKTQLPVEKKRLTENEKHLLNLCKGWLGTMARMPKFTLPNLQIHTIYHRHKN